jgi:hypothetical protein
MEAGRMLASAITSSQIAESAIRRLGRDRKTCGPNDARDI